MSDLRVGVAGMQVWMTDGVIVYGQSERSVYRN